MKAKSMFSEPIHDKRIIRYQTSSWQVNSRSYSWRPPTDVFEIDNRLIIRIEIAGMRQSEISIKLKDNCLMISGSRKESHEKRAYHQMEIRFGDFNAIIDLPKGLAVDAIEANYEEGFLTISIPFTLPTSIHPAG